MTSPVPVIALFGPTAVGKTELLVSLFPGKGEVISADSMQVYRYMDIGTAKPDRPVRTRIPHHLIDILDPGEQYSLGMFLDGADELARDISRRGYIPVISGGTAYYFKHFLFGMPETPKGDPVTRDQIRRELETRGIDVLRRRLEALDPDAAAKIGKNDRYRITRALEVIEQTGRKFSSFQLPSAARPDFSVLLIGLKRDKEDLYRRIDARVDDMFRRGLADEIRALMTRGYGPSDPGFHGIGYREFTHMLKDGCCTLGGVRDLIKRHSRQYAKRQMTFFNSLPGVRWFSPDEKAEIKSCIDGFLV